MFSIVVKLKAFFVRLGDTAIVPIGNTYTCTRHTGSPREEKKIIPFVVSYISSSLLLSFSLHKYSALNNKFTTQNEAQREIKKNRKHIIFQANECGIHVPTATFCIGECILFSHENVAVLLIELQAFFPFITSALTFLRRFTSNFRPQIVRLCLYEYVCVCVCCVLVILLIQLFVYCLRCTIKYY